MAYCKRCGVVLEENMFFCPQCGQSQRLPMNAEYIAQEQFTRKKKSYGLAITSMIFGILSLIATFSYPYIPIALVFYLACGIVAISLSSSPRRKMNGRGMALAGMITGTLTVIFVPLLLLLHILVAIGVIS